MRTGLYGCKRILAGGLALFTAAGLSVVIAQPAQAVPIVAFVGYVKQAYDLYEKYRSSGDPGVVSQLQASVAQAKAQILAQIDNNFAVPVRVCAESAVNNVPNIPLMTTDRLQEYASDAAACVSTAKFDIEGFETLGAVDTIGFALNAVGPIALIANQKAGFATDTIRQNLIEANQRLYDRLRPKCGVTPSVDVHAAVVAGSPSPVPGDLNHVPIPGTPSCYNYTRTTATVDRSVVVFPAGHGTGTAPWTVTGEGVPEICYALFHCGDHVNWPGGTDFSIAENQAMVETSWNAAKLSLDQLRVPAGPAGSAITVARSTSNFSPMEVFGTNISDSVYRNTQLTAAGRTTFPAWTNIGGPLRSVSAASNVDGRVEVFGISRAGRVFHSWQQNAGDDTSWSPWAEFEGLFNSVAVARNKSGSLQLFGTNPQGDVWTNWQIRGTALGDVNNWSSWRKIDGGLDQVAAATNQNGTIELVGVNASGWVFRRRQTAPNAMNPDVAGNWTPWTQLPERNLRTVALTAGWDQKLELFGTDSADRVFHRSQAAVNSTNWNGWSQVPGALRTVSAITDSAGRLNLFGINSSGSVLWSTDSFHNGVLGTPWIKLPGDLRP